MAPETLNQRGNNGKEKNTKKETTAQAVLGGFMAKKFFESFRVEENDDNTFSIDFRPIKKKEKNTDHMTFHDEGKSMTASNKDDLMKKIGAFFKGKNAVKEFLEGD